MQQAAYDNAMRNGGPLLLNSQQAAELLGISRKTLWAHTAPKGHQIPVVRIGRVIRYRRESLEQWIRQRERGEVGDVPA